MASYRSQGTPDGTSEGVCNIPLVVTARFGFLSQRNDFQIMTDAVGVLVNCPFGKLNRFRTGVATFMLVVVGYLSCRQFRMLFHELPVDLLEIGQSLIIFLVERRIA